MICIRCRRPLKHATDTGMGPVCARAAQASRPVEVDRDLFGFDLDRAVHAAQSRLKVDIAAQVAQELVALRQAFHLARQERRLFAHGDWYTA